MKRLAVYCGSATPADPTYMEIARHTGRSLAERGIGVVYGGGRLGLMGAVADSAMAAGGKVIGVIPDALVGAEVAHRGLTELQVVRNMHQRKQAFTDLSDGFVTIPGGTGTMDELWEALSWAQLGYHAKPVGLLNAGGYYDHIVAFWEKMGEVGFLREQHRELLIVEDSLDALLDRMAAHVPRAETITKMDAKDL
ncbi:TIGR00730 family Rossman fold protein [soil metagenome]